MEGRNEKIICLFDVDGTLTKPRNVKDILNIFYKN
jgi:hypothetical protein